MVVTIDSWNRVLGNLKVSLKGKVATENFTTSTDDSPPSFPSVCVKMFDNQGSYDLENEECYAINSFDIITFSSKNLTEARNLLGIADVGMARMGFQRKGTTREYTTGIPNIKGMIARYSRVLGDVSQIEKFN